MTHEIDHIWCGGAGEKLGEKTIKIWDHKYLNVAVNLQRDHLAEVLGEKRAERYDRRLHRFFDELYEDLAADGVEVHRHQPHAENFE